MLVNIDNDTALEMLLNRLEHWTDDDITYNLYEAMYENYIYNCCYEGGDFDVMSIVDNDYVNWCDVISEGDQAYEDIKRLYDEQGIGDISCEYDLNNGYGYIEAEYEGSFLVRS